MDCAASNGPMQTVTRRMGRLHRRKRRTTKVRPQFAAMRFGRAERTLGSSPPGSSLESPIWGAPCGDSWSDIRIKMLQLWTVDLPCG